MVKSVRANSFEMRSRVRSILILFVSCWSLAGCTFFKTTTIDAEGRKETKYFQTDWDLFKFSVGHDVELELAGEKPPGQRQYWQDWWDSRILALRQNRTNPERHIAYIHTRRKEAGLPPLE